MKVSRRRFEALVKQALLELPADLRHRLNNLAIRIAQRPRPDQRRDLDLAGGEVLLGLYQGVPQIQRGADYGNVLPDQIFLFVEPIAGPCRNTLELAGSIRSVLYHEIGHHFGFSEEALEALDRGRQPE